MQTTYEVESILALMDKVYDWQKNNQVRYVTRSSGKIRFIKDTDWERGVFWSCVSHVGILRQRQAYLDGVLNYTLHTGFRPGPLARFADDWVCIQSYTDIYPLIAIDDALDHCRKVLDVFVNEPKPGREDWWWCDSLFMAPPSLAAMSRLTGNQRYLEAMETAWWDAVKHLYDPETGLFYRDARYIPNQEGSELREANNQKVFWSRGIGWVLAAVPRLMRHFPTDYPHRDKYLALFTQLARTIKDYQQPDGFWRTSLLDPDNYPAPESSATALFCYGITWGIRHGLLTKAEFLPVAEHAWQALTTAVHSDGMMGWVQLPAFNPRDVKFEHNMDYGAGAFLLAASEWAALVQDSQA